MRWTPGSNPTAEMISVDPYAIVGLELGLLEEEPRGYLDSLYRGSLLLMVSLAGMILLYLAAVMRLTPLVFFLGILFPSVRANFGYTSLLASILPFATLIVPLGAIPCCVGWLLFATPLPGRTVTGAADFSRDFSRLGMIASFLLFPFYSVWALRFFAGGGPPRLGGLPATANIVVVTLIMVGGTALFAAQSFHAMRHAESVANRIPNSWLASRARRMTWLGPAVFLLGSPFFGLGPLVAMGLYWNLFRQLKNGVDEVRRNAAAKGAARHG